MEKKHSESFDDEMGFEESDEYRLDQEGIWAE
jgi:hypothetical protein